MGKSVLIVDDSITMQRIMKNILRWTEHRVVGEASDGIQAVRAYKELRPDITIMDIFMPNMDGMEAVKEIIAYDPKATIIVSFSSGHELSAVEAIRHGARGSIRKPFTVESFKAIIEKY